MTVVTPQFGFNDTVMPTVGLEAWHGPGDINLYGEVEMLKEWASRKDRYHASIGRCRISISIGKPTGRADLH